MSSYVNSNDIGQYLENAAKLASNLKIVDSFVNDLNSSFDDINSQHKCNGVHIEYAYLKHFLQEALDISALFQQIFDNECTKKFLPISNRMMLEILLRAEYVIRLKKQDSDKVLSLLSKDMASVMSALDEAVGTPNTNPAKNTLKKLDVANKKLGTDFDLDKIKSNTTVFPAVKDLCNKSKICLKDYCGEKMYHYYSMWSWSSHSRLGNNSPLEGDGFGKVVNNHMECFLELYLKLLQLLAIHCGDEDVWKEIVSMMSEIGVNKIQ
jgi:hypothetical protein